MTPDFSRILAILNATDLSSQEKVARIREVFVEAGAFQIPGVIARLVATPKSEGGFHWVNEMITDENFPTTAEPSLEGARLDEILGSRDEILAELARQGRRAATAAEGLLYGVKNPEELREYWIAVLGQFWLSCRRKHVVVLRETDGKRRASLVPDTDELGLRCRRVLSFPL